MLNYHNIDLKNEFDALQNEFGVDILYMRANKYIRCKCYDVLHQCGNPKCPTCLGLGHITSIEKKQVITQTPPTSAKNSITTAEFGLVHSQAMTMYTRESVLSKERDFILITTWDKKGFPVSILKVFEIVNVQPVRDTNGKTALCANYVKLRTDMTLDANRYINLLSNEAKFTLSRGRRYLWPIVI